MNYWEMHTEHCSKPYVTNVTQNAMNNNNFRSVLWTGCYAQMTLMSIPVCSDIGVEIHKDTDQIIRIEQGTALVEMGKCEHRMDFQSKVCEGGTIFVPAGTWHNITNIGKIPMKLSSIYAPPHHPPGTVHRTKADSQKSNY